MSLIAVRRMLPIVAFSLALAAHAAPHRRALLIGINDYTASHIAPHAPPAPERDWPNLGGGVNDVASMHEILTRLYGFQERETITLIDQAATRAAILRAIEQHLVAPAAKGDVIFFYYAGHGSQVRNSRSDELDQLDESLVPADSRRGAADIRDKELRRLFNRILDRGAHLTVMLDDCHSGSGARGLATGATVRGVRPDLRDVADGADAGPRPEDRGALVLSASQDDANAAEAKSSDGKIRGVFTWAWMRAMRDASDGEPAIDTFLRARARLRAETPYQDPVIAANSAARRTPFLGTFIDRRPERTIVAAEKVRDDGTVMLLGGWANGLSVGSELRVPNDPRTRVTITALIGLTRSEAHVAHGRVEAGMLLDVAGWVGAPAPPLRVWMPRVATSSVPIEGIARLLSRRAARRDIRWITDPTTTSPMYLLRRRERGWELLAPDGAITSFGADDAGAEAAVSAIPPDSSLFVQLPAPAALIAGLALGETIVPTSNPAEADYVLTGRFVRGRLTYAWVRPGVTRADRRKTGLPVRTSWVASDAPAALHDAVLALRKILAWQMLESPAVGRSPYHLALRRDADMSLVRGTSVVGGQRYRIVLRGVNLPPRLDRRYVYVFVIDSHGKSVLLFPRDASGSVENRFPLSEASPPEEIPVAGFDVSRPYGVDTYFLLTTDEALPNPSILEWNGVRRDAASTSTPLARLLLETGWTTRSILIPSSWSIERVTWKSTTQKSAGGV